MPPKLALILCAGLIVYLFRQERRLRPHVFGALWIPTLWLMIISSRPISMWLSGAATGSLSESALDAGIYLVLIAAALVVLAKRGFSLPQLIANNQLLVLYFLYCLLSIAWSDDSFVSFKRWFKSSVGNTAMCLVILTEFDPVNAVKTVARRCSYILLPTSILLIKYFPELGRHYGPWGDAQNTGVGLNKNDLGYLCLVMGFPLIWSFYMEWKNRRSPGFVKAGLHIYALLVYMVGYLLVKSSSATAMGALIIASGVIWVLGLERVKRRVNKLGAYTIIMILLILPILLLGSDLLLSEAVEATGHENTFQGRVELWKDLLNVGVNPLIGTGYDNFWNRRDFLGPIWESRWWKPTQSHNGYVESYLNLGWIGLILFFLLLIQGFNKIKHTLATNHDFGQFKMGFFIIALIYNVTETAFRGLSPVYFMLLLVLIGMPGATMKMQRFEPTMAPFEGTR